MDKGNIIAIAVIAGIIAICVLITFMLDRFARWKLRDAASLPSEDVSALCAARDGSIWIGYATGGVTRIHGSQVHHYLPVELQPPMISESSGAYKITGSAPE